MGVEIIINLVLIPVFSLLFGSFCYMLYEHLNKPDKVYLGYGGFYILKTGKKTISNITSKTNHEYNNTIYKITPILVLVISLLSLYLLPINNISIMDNLPMGTIYVMFLLTTIVLIYGLASLVLGDRTKIFAAKEWINHLVLYYLPMGLSILAIYYQYTQLTGNPHAIPSFKEIIIFQTAHKFKIFNLTLPSLFIFLNPFAALSFFTSVLGILRRKNLGRPKNEPLNVWDIFRAYSGHNLGILIIEEIFRFFIYITIFGALFLGNFIIPIGIPEIILQMAGLLIITVLVGVIGRGKPRIWLERGIIGYIRTPLIFGLLSIIYPFFINGYINLI